MKNLATLALASALPLTACGGTSAPSETQTGETAAFVAHGAEVYATAGCAGCHGAPSGEGPHREGTPTFDVFVDRFGLETNESRNMAIDYLASGDVHDPAIDDAPHPFEGFESFVITSRLYGELIAGTDHASFMSRMELGGDMPEWGGTLSQSDIDAVLAYLIHVGVE